MAKSLANVVIATDTFASWITRTNQLIAALDTEIITANTSPNGANTTGNTNLIGVFGANTVAVGTNLRGGTVNAAANLTISSNVAMTGNVTTVSSNLHVVNSNTTINSISTSIIGPTLNIGSNTTVTGTLNIQGDQVSATANVVLTGSNTTIQSNTFNLTSNTTTITGNNVVVNGASMSVQSNATFTGQTTTGNTNITGDLYFSTNRMRTTGVSNGNLGATTNTAIDVASWPITWNAADIITRVGNTTATRASKILIASAGNNAYMTEYAVLNAPTSSNLGVYSVTANTTDVILRFTPYVANLSLNLNINLAD